MLSLGKNSLRNTLVKHGALLGLLAILLGQAALAAHDLVFDHEDEDSCLVCHLSDRQDGVTGLAENTNPGPGAATVLAVVPATSPASNTPVDLTARGPPSYL
jgi:hypothetical protein